VSLVDFHDYMYTLECILVTLMPLYCRGFWTSGRKLWSVYSCIITVIQFIAYLYVFVLIGQNSCTEMKFGIVSAGCNIMD